MTTAPNAIPVDMPTLHHGQLAVYEAGKTTRFRVLVAGRRWRKTSLGVVECIEAAMAGGRAWWCAPTYKQAAEGWGMLVRAIRDLPRVEVRAGEMAVRFPGGGIVEVRSTDNPDTLRGAGLDFVVLDEAALMDERVWTEVLRPSLTDRQGRALFISTPRGRNWFWRLYSDAERQEGWARFQFPSSSNPVLSSEEIVLAQQQLPDAVFRQEYLAEFRDDAGAVFRNVDGCVGGLTTAPAPMRRYVAGVDLARINDWTVLTIADAMTRHVVELDRWQLVDWAITYDRIARECTRYNGCTAYVDSTGLGDVVVADLRRAGVPVEPYTLTGDHGPKQGTKTELINALVLAIEQEKIRYPRIDVLVDELKAYEYKLSKSGNVATGAPDGYHDDCVISLALCNWGLNQAVGGGPRKGVSMMVRS